MVVSFDIEYYRSSSTFVTIDILFQELLSFVQKSFPGFSFMFADIKLKLGSKLSYEEFHIKLDLGYGWPASQSHCPLFKIRFPDFSL